MRLSRRAAACLAAALAAAPAHAAWRPLQLDPTTARISYTVFALGLLPITATFQKFHGVALQDTSHPGTCRIDVTIDVASLHMDDPDRQRQALAPDMLDAADFPTMRFTGACAARSIAGKLTLHGVTRPVTLVMQRNGPQVRCTGTLARRDFGILGLRGLVAANVRLRLVVQLPD
jgi:polyisoprenoid-binding protein YceI